MTPFKTIKVKGVIRAQKHYKHINVMIDDLPEGQHCKDIAVVQQIQILRPGSNKIPAVLRNLSGRVLKIMKGLKIAHVEASTVVVPQLNENVPKKVAGNDPKGNLLGNLLEENRGRLEKLFESLNLDNIESWNEQQQQSVRDLLMEHQYLFAMNLSGLGKTSLVQHDIKLDDMTPFKEHYQRIPQHQYEEVKKHLQEMMEIGAIYKSTSPWASPIVLVHKKDGGLWFCIDLRKFNNKTIKDAQSLPRIEDSRLLR